ncbi:hypothetical protein [Streptomyces herbicida]|uniref:hypothetical protein n=1 Tax=Streptomyces herbicida TaxID=3065675 RepID=UPI00292D1A70|nr:hypothetical protein [Streptomyces sp. NEAU-HV9]
MPRAQITERTRHRYEDTHRLLEKGWTISAIAQENVTLTPDTISALPAEADRRDAKSRACSRAPPLGQYPVHHGAAVEAGRCMRRFCGLVQSTADRADQIPPEQLGIVLARPYGDASDGASPAPPGP